MWLRRRSTGLAGAMALAALPGCGGAERAANAAAAAPASSATATATSAATPVRTAARPADACGWIPAAEVEALVGALAGPPRPEGSECVYPLPLDAETRRQLERGREIDRQLIGPDAPSLRDPQPDEAAVIVEVDLTGGVVGERAERLMAEHLAGMLADATPRVEPPAPPAGWDYAGAPMGRAGFTGRVGHVGVTVTERNMRLTPERRAMLAARVRDRIPDLPFAYPAPGAPPDQPPPSPDPCGVLSRAEAEAVLGPLVVPPYRSRNEGPLADGRGTSCAYFTAGHHVLVLTPEWSFGESALGAVRGAGDLRGAVIHDAEAHLGDTLVGPWDDMVADGSRGALYFLKGDRLIQVGYALSSTDQAGAVRLATVALARMAARPGDGRLPP